MGGAAYSTNNRVNAAVAAKANARQPLEEVVSLNADPFPSTVPRQAKFYSDMSMAERRVVDEARDASIAATELRREEQRVANPDFDLVNFYENKLASADTGAEAKKKVLTAHDPNRGELSGTTPTGYLLDQQVGDPFIEAVRTYEVPLTQKADSPIELDYDYGYDADNLYMKQPPLQGKLNLQQGFTDEEREQYRDLMDRGSFIDISGGTSKVGEYSMVWVEDPPEPSGISKFLNNPILSVIGALNPVVGLATTATKAATGEKLSPMEIASSMLTGLEMAGVIKPPVAGASVAPKGGVGPVLPSGGTGLFNSTYAQTQTALNVAAAGDLKGAALSLVGTDLLTNNLDKIGLNKEAIESAGIQYDDFEAGLNKVVSAVAGGENLDDALVQGLGKYIREGGTLGSVDLPSVDLGVDLSGLGKMVETIVNTAEDIGRPLVALAEDVSKPVGDVLSELDTAVRQALPDISIDLPSVDLPSVDLPSIDLSLGTNGMLQSSPTATTDKLFGDELFKFKTEIGLDIEPLEYVDLNAPADNFFEDTLYEDPILGRSYNF